MGTPPSWSWLGTPPPPHGILGNVANHYEIWVPPPSWTWPGTPLCPMAFWVMLQSIMGYGYPPNCEQTNKVKLLPSRRTTYAGGKKTDSLAEVNFLGRRGCQHSGVFVICLTKVLCKVPGNRMESKQIKSLRTRPS